MKIYDMHIHASNGQAQSPDRLIAEMNVAGITGGCIFSTPPKEQKISDQILGGLDYEARISEVLGWCRGYEDRLFPVLWIHPDEENAADKVRLAKKRGIAALKMIPSDYYVYEDRAMAVIRAAAECDLPIFFHSGILWDGQVSSSYNRPVNWEALLQVDGLRFSMGHCSWPWVDECIALYGKFIHSLRCGCTARMYLDITPGTPKIYREELFTKLYTVGYDVSDNVLFGTDATASSYCGERISERLRFDGRILDKLGISLDMRERMYGGNLMHFLGKEKAESEKKAEFNPYSDGSREIIEKWYYRLPFPKYYEAEFKKALPQYKISDAVSIENYDTSCEDGKRNLLSYLYMCEKTAEKYREMGIGEDILDATLEDIVVYAKHWSRAKKTLYLGETSWLSRHLKLDLFRLGRLQFAMGKAKEDIPSHGIVKGDPILEVHIPEGAPLGEAECLESFRQAEEFFPRFFPQFKYKAFTTGTWLLDPTLKKYLNEKSNILKFQKMFTPISRREAYDLVHYVFPWDTRIDTLADAVCRNSFAEKIKAAVLSGEVFLSVYGVREAKRNGG